MDADQIAVMRGFHACLDAIADRNNRFLRARRPPRTRGQSADRNRRYGAGWPGRSSRS
jgi:hypothetical protein